MVLFALAFARSTNGLRHAGGTRISLLMVPTALLRRVTDTATEWQPGNYDNDRAADLLICNASVNKL